ncbi:MAG: hypothetical protein ACI9F9_000535 [Candidatus Paceibacteria bacterium]|jgi:hypothetical protein
MTRSLGSDPRAVTLQLAMVREQFLSVGCKFRICIVCNHPLQGCLRFDLGAKGSVENAQRIETHRVKTESPSTRVDRASRPSQSYLSELGDRVSPLARRSTLLCIKNNGEHFHPAVTICAEPSPD